MAETVRDVVFRLKIELAEAAMKAPEVRPVIEAQEKVKKAATDTAREFEKAADVQAKGTERVGETLRRNYEKNRAAKEREARELERFNRQIIRDDERVVREHEKAVEKQARAAENAAKLQERAFFKVSQAMTRALDGAVGLTKGIALLGVSGEKDTEKLIRGFVKISAGIDVLKGTLAMYKAVTEAIRAATAAQIALNAAQAGGGGGKAAGMMGIASGLASGVGRGGSVAIGTAVGLGVIGMFHQGTREGLGELLGFSDMAGDERTKGDRMATLGQAYSRSQIIMRTARQQADMMRLERETVGMPDLETADRTAAGLRSMLGGEGGPKRDLEIQNEILRVEQQRLELIQQRVKSQQEAVKATEKEIEAQNAAFGGAAMNVLNMKPGQQRQLAAAFQAAQSGQQLTPQQMQMVAANSALAGPGLMASVNAQALARLQADPNLAPLAAHPQQAQAQLQAQLASRQAQLDATMQQYGQDFQQRQETIIRAVMDQALAAMDVVAQQMAGEEMRQAAIQAATARMADNPDRGGVSATRAFFNQLLWGGGSQVSQAAPRPNGR